VRNKCCGLDVASGGGERQGETNSQHGVYLLGLPRGKHAGVRCTASDASSTPSRTCVVKLSSGCRLRHGWQNRIYICIYRYFKDIQLYVFTTVLVTLSSTHQESSPGLFDSEQAFAGDVGCGSLRLNTSKPTVNNTIVQAPDRTTK
jgi:hypothetical protein